MIVLIKYLLQSTTFFIFSFIFITLLTFSKPLT